MILSIYFPYIKIQEGGIMAKKKKRSKSTNLGKTIGVKQPIEIPISVSEPQQKQHFELFSLSMISLHEDYKVYRIVTEGEKMTVGYLGVFNSGIFNYVVVREKNEIDEVLLLRFLKKFIRDSGLTPMLNPHMKEYL